MNILKSATILSFTFNQINMQLLMAQHQNKFGFKENIMSIGFSHFFKGTVSREKLLNWGLGKMVWTLIIDHNWVLHFSDQLFNCHNIWTVCCLHVKPVWSLSGTVALRWLNCACWCCSQVTASALLLQSAHFLCCCCSPHTNSVLLLLSSPQ